MGWNKINKTIKKQIRYLLFLFMVVLLAEICHPEFGLGHAGREVLASQTQEDDADRVEPQTETQSESQPEAQSEVQTDTQVQTDADKGSGLALSSPSAILMEASTGGVIYEKDADKILSPASITKIMTLLLIFEQMEQGKIKLEDEVVTSAYAKSMGGSQVFLEEGEIQTVETMIKCIAVASGNDASVAMAEKIAGSEEAFVQMMNQRAGELGMKNTHFVDCCGLTSSGEHYTSARDVAIMARALIQKYPEVFQYTTIWMEDIVHETKQGSKPFTLSSTNKLLKQYEYTTGLKTGSTSVAKYCFCATARKNDIDLIAVVMAAPDHKVRFEDAKKMLIYGYSLSQLYQDTEKPSIHIKVLGGKEDEVVLSPKEEFRYLDITGADLDLVEKKMVYDETVLAPVEKNAQAGSMEYYLNGNKIGSVPLVYTCDVEKATYRDNFMKVFRKMLL